MSSTSPFAEARIGCVGYLNARPLIVGIEEHLRLDHPSRLAGALFAGSLDGALVPVFEALAHPGGYVAVDGLGIVAVGEVYSVVLAHEGPLESIQSIALDPASLTSVNLCKILFAEFFAQRIAYTVWDGLDSPAPGRAILMIGDQAIRFRQAHPGFEFLDLGEAWMRFTGLPFVFAVWLLQANCPDLQGVAETLRASAAQGLQHLDEIRKRPGEFTPEFNQRYLGGYIRYQVGPREREAIRKYGQLLVKHSLIKQPAGELAWL